MNYRQVISEAWVFTQKSKNLIIWFGFIPSLLTTTVGIGYIGYQFFALKESYLFSNSDGHFLYDVVGFAWEFINAHLNLTVPIIIFAAIFAIGYFLFPTLAKASAIQAIARDKNGQKSGVGVGFRHGIMSFLPLLEYHLIIKTFSFFAVLIEMSFVLRNLGPEISKILFPILIFIMIIGLFLTLLFTFADFYIVVDNDGVVESIKKSSRLVFIHWKHTFLISLLMLIIGVRIIIQAIMVLLIPAIIVLLASYIATIALPVTGVIVGGIVGVLSLIIASYLNGIVDIFSYSVWTYTFLDLSNKEEHSARDVLA